MSKRLPDKPSEILRVALADLEIIEKNPKYVINMLTWHAPDINGTCRVCLAGSTLANTIKLDPSMRFSSDMCLDQETIFKMKFINRIRIGDMSFAIRSFSGREFINEDIREKLLIAENNIVKFFKAGSGGFCVGSFSSGVPLSVGNYAKGRSKQFKDYICDIIGIFEAEGI